MVDIPTLNHLNFNIRLKSRQSTKLFPHQSSLEDFRYAYYSLKFNHQELLDRSPRLVNEWSDNNRFYAYWNLLFDTSYGKMIKECLITVGATAKFPELIQAALSSEALQSFSDNGFTRLNFQCGESISEFESYKPSDTKGLEIKAFAFNKDGLNKEMRATQAKAGVSEKGMVICHAGAGSVLDAMRLGLSIIVVPNMTLLDNHQEELANELQKQGYVTKATTKNLARKITTACKKEEKAWGGHSASFASVVDEVVGYEDDVRARLD